MRILGKIIGILVGVSAGTALLYFSWQVLPKNFSAQNNSKVQDKERGNFALFRGSTSCNFPITYEIGNVNSGFGMSEEEYMDAIREAESVWEETIGINIFDYDEEGILDINLLFDERQADTNRIKELMENIESNEEKYNVAKDEYDSLLTKLENKEATYERSLANYDSEAGEFESSLNDYNEKVEDYDKDVEYWNSKGGAPKDEYEKLEEEKEDLDDERSDLKKEEKSLESLYQSLEAERKELNKLVDEVNTLAGILNRLAEKSNMEVDNYNKVQTSREEFETGQYKTGKEVTEINIYQFYDEEDLVLILIHEMGHAIGLEHAGNPESVMYPMLQDQKAELSEEDIKMFQEKCGS